tara:strand:- start:70 stop:3153 length:3084 start_codon:yes stop_codon:yes gene_type:complete
MGLLEQLLAMQGQGQGMPPQQPPTFGQGFGQPDIPFNPVPQGGMPMGTGQPQPMPAPAPPIIGHENLTYEQSNEKLNSELDGFLKLREKREALRAAGLKPNGYEWLDSPSDQWADGENIPQGYEGYPGTFKGNTPPPFGKAEGHHRTAPDGPQARLGRSGDLRALDQAAMRQETGLPRPPLTPERAAELGFPWEPQHEKEWQQRKDGLRMSELTGDPVNPSLSSLLGISPSPQYLEDWNALNQDSQGNPLVGAPPSPPMESPAQQQPAPQQPAPAPPMQMPIAPQPTYDEMVRDNNNRSLLTPGELQQVEEHERALRATKQPAFPLDSESGNTYGPLVDSVGEWGVSPGQPQSEGPQGWFAQPGNQPAPPQMPMPPSPWGLPSQEVLPWDDHPANIPGFGREFPNASQAPQQQAPYTGSPNQNADIAQKFTQAIQDGGMPPNYFGDQAPQQMQPSGNALRNQQRTSAVFPNASQPQQQPQQPQFQPSEAALQNQQRTRGMFPGQSDAPLDIPGMGREFPDASAETIAGDPWVTPLADAQRTQEGLRGLLNRLQNPQKGGIPVHDGVVQGKEFQDNRQKAAEIREYTGGINADHARVTDAEYDQLSPQMKERVTTTGDPLTGSRHRPGLLDEETEASIRGNVGRSRTDPSGPYANGFGFKSPMEVPEPREQSLDQRVANAKDRMAKRQKQDGKSFGSGSGSGSSGGGGGAGGYGTPETKSDAPGMAEKRAEHKALIAAKENRKKRSDLDLDESDRLVHRNAAARGYKRKGFGRNQAYNVANEDAFMPNAQKILNDPDSTPEAKHAALERAMPGRGKGGKGNTRMTYQQYIDGATTAARKANQEPDIPGYKDDAIALDLPGAPKQAAPVPGADNGAKPKRMSVKELFPNAHGADAYINGDPGKINYDSVRGGYESIGQEILDDPKGGGRAEYDRWTEYINPASGFAPSKLNQKGLDKLNRQRKSLGLGKIDYSPKHHKDQAAKEKERKSNLDAEVKKSNKKTKKYEKNAGKNWTDPDGPTPRKALQGGL